MPKLFICFVALLLIPCLLIDPLAASELSAFSFNGQRHSFLVSQPTEISTSFQEQAITPYLLGELHLLYSEKNPISRRLQENNGASHLANEIRHRPKKNRRLFHPGSLLATAVGLSIAQVLGILPAHLPTDFNGAMVFIAIVYGVTHLALHSNQNLTHDRDARMSLLEPQIPIPSWLMQVLGVSEEEYRSGAFAWRDPRVIVDYLQRYRDDPRLWNSVFQFLETVYPQGTRLEVLLTETPGIAWTLGLRRYTARLLLEAMLQAKTIPDIEAIYKRILSYRLTRREAIKAGFLITLTQFLRIPVLQDPTMEPNSTFIPHVPLDIGTGRTRMLEVLEDPGNWRSPFRHPDINVDYRYYEEGSLPAMLNAAAERGARIAQVPFSTLPVDHQARIIQIYGGKIPRADQRFETLIPFRNLPRTQQLDLIHGLQRFLLSQKGEQSLQKVRKDVRRDQVEYILKKLIMDEGKQYLQESASYEPTENQSELLCHWIMQRLSSPFNRLLREAEAMIPGHMDIGTGTLLQVHSRLRDSVCRWVRLCAPLENWITDVSVIPPLTHALEDALSYPLDIITSEGQALLARYTPEELKRRPDNIWHVYGAEIFHRIEQDFYTLLRTNGILLSPPRGNHNSPAELNSENLARKILQGVIREALKGLVFNDPSRVTEALYYQVQVHLSNPNSPFSGRIVNQMRAVMRSVYNEREEQRRQIEDQVKGEEHPTFEKLPGSQISWSNLLHGAFINYWGVSPTPQILSVLQSIPKPDEVSMDHAVTAIASLERDAQLNEGLLSIFRGPHFYERWIAPLWESPLLAWLSFVISRKATLTAAGALGIVPNASPISMAMAVLLYAVIFSMVSYLINVDVFRRAHRGLRSNLGEAPLNTHQIALKVSTLGLSSAFIALVRSFQKFAYDLFLTTRRTLPLVSSFVRRAT